MHRSDPLLQAGSPAENVQQRGPISENLQDYCYSCRILRIQYFTDFCEWYRYWFYTEKRNAIFKNRLQAYWYSVFYQLQPDRKSALCFSHHRYRYLWCPQTKKKNRIVREHIAKQSCICYNAIRQKDNRVHMARKRTNPRMYQQYIRGFFFFCGEANRSGLVTDYSSPSSHLHR